MRVRASSFVTAIAASALSIVVPARAETTELVMLKDGTSISGALLEFTDGDHITIRLPTGETRRVEWSDIASSSQLPGPTSILAPPPAPPPLVPTTPAPNRSVVVLKDGSVVSGEVLESIQGDHVTIRTADDAVKRFDWSNVSFVVNGGFSLPNMSGATTTTSGLPSGAQTTIVTPPSVTYAAANRDLPTVTTWPEPDREARPILASRLALGLESSFGGPLGRYALDAGWYPIRWVGFDVAVGLPLAGAPTTTAENMFFAWPIFGPVEMGFGAGLAQSFVDGANGGHSGVVSNLELEAAHLTLFFTRELSLRGGMGIDLNLSGGSYCDAHPDTCPRMNTLNGTATLSWNFDLSHGQL